MNEISRWLESLGIHPFAGGIIVGAVLFWILGRLFSGDKAVQVMGASTAHGQAAADLSEREQALILQLMRQGQKIEAIKMLRERTSLGLAEAKHFVEELEENSP